MARSLNHPTPTSQRRSKAVRRRLESLLSDTRYWPKETAPLRVRARVMSNLAAQRQADAANGRPPQHVTQQVTMYRETGWSGQRLEFSLRPPLAAAAVIAMIVSAAVHFMGGTEAWQPWADGLANRFYDVESGNRAYHGSAFAEADPLTNPETFDAGKSEAEALFSDVARFRDHMTGRIPTSEPSPSRDTPRQAPPPQRRNDPDPSSS